MIKRTALAAALFAATPALAADAPPTPPTFNQQLDAIVTNAEALSTQVKSMRELIIDQDAIVRQQMDANTALSKEVAEMKAKEKAAPAAKK